MKSLLVTLFILSSLSVRSEVFKKEKLVSLNEIHPTQAFIGLDQIPDKVRKILKKYKKDSLDDYLKEKWTPAILGPDQKYWIIDHHHLSFALLKADIPKEKKRLYLKIIHDWSNKNWNTFAQEMEREKFLYLKDDNFNTLNFQDIPENIESLKDNPYRSLAYFAREEGCFDKVDIPFLEFTWAEFFYLQSIRINSDRNYQRALKAALELCHSREASNLPGFKEKIIP